MAHTDIRSSDLRGTSPAELEMLEQDLAASVDGVPLLSRGGGTSLAGQCTNTAVVIDRSKLHLAELLATAGALDYERPEAAAAPRPANPSPGARAATLAVAASLAGAGAAAAIWAMTRRGARR